MRLLHLLEALSRLEDNLAREEPLDFPLIGTVGPFRIGRSS